MSYTVDIIFHIKPKPISKKMVSCLVNAVMGLGSNYIETLGYWSDRDDRGPFEGSLEKAIEVVSRDQGVIWFHYKDIVYGLGIRPTPIAGTLGWISLSSDEIFFNRYHNKNEVLKNSQQFIEVAKCLWNALEQKPIYGIGDYRVIETPRPSEEDILNQKIEPFIFWLNFYGPELINKFGKENMLSLPAYDVKELKHGVLFVEHPSIFDFNKRTHKDICDHLNWKVYYLKIFFSDKPSVMEIGTYDKEFSDLNTLKEFLKNDIKKFREIMEEGRIFAMLEIPYEPVSQYITEMESWLKDKGVETKVISGG